MNDLPRERIRRDYTNASGYVCPTENQAIYNVDRGICDSYTAPMRQTKTEVLKTKNPPTPPKEKDENLKRARQLYGVLCNIAGMMDCTIKEITIKHKGDPSRYKNIGEKKTIEREV